MSKIIMQLSTTPSPSAALDINLRVSYGSVQRQRHRSDISLSEGARTSSRLLLFSRHGNCSLSVNDPMSRSLPRTDESGGLLARTDT